MEDLVTGRRLDDLRANLQLTLRHASGTLFQEAHMIALFDTFEQTRLGGFSPRPVSVALPHTSTGAHFTPSSLARTLVEQTLPTIPDAPQITVFDPACGSGEFLKEALRLLRLRGYTGHINLRGFDISEAACALARFTLKWEAMSSAETATSLAVDIQCQDALTATWPDNVSLLLMNPPFLAWPDMSGPIRDHVQSILRELAHYRPDLASAFVWKAAQATNSGAVLGMILPASLLDGDSYAKLRQALRQRMSITLAARLGSHSIFKNARVDAALLAGTRREGNSGCEPEGLAVWADHRETSSSSALRHLRRLSFASRAALPLVGDGFSIYPMRAPEEGSSWAPRPYNEWELIDSLSSLPKVKDLFRVQQGIRTGLNAVFLVDKAHLDTVPENEQSFFRPAVLNESIVSSRLLDKVYIFYPYGESAVDDENTLRAAIPKFFHDRLAPAKADLLSRVRIDESSWWHLSEPRKSWATDRSPKIVSTYFGDRGSFAWDETGSYAVVQGFAWHFRRSRSIPRAVWTAYLAILNSKLFSALLAATSNNVGGGQWNLSKKFVDQIPLPDLFATDQDLVRQLAEIGEEIHSRGLNSIPDDEHERLQELTEAAFHGA